MASTQRTASAIVTPQVTLGLPYNVLRHNIVDHKTWSQFGRLDGHVYCPASPWPVVTGAADAHSDAFLSPTLEVGRLLSLLT